MLEEKMPVLKKKLIEDAVLIKAMIEKSLQGLLKKDERILTDVIKHYEPRANVYDSQLDELCTTMVAQYEPKAKDLRTILMILKINNDLERMGDHAVNISESGLFLISHPDIKPLVNIPKMAEVTTQMVKDSIDAFIDENAALAKKVCMCDDVVDDLGDNILRKLMGFMSTDPTTVERALHLIRISHNLERIADLSTNICEDVIFMVEGKVIKHHLEEEGSK